MNRRELFRRITGAASAGVAVYALDAPVDAKSTLAIMKAQGVLSQAAVAHIRDVWERATKDTNWHGVKLVVLDQNLSIEVHQR